MNSVILHSGSRIVLPIALAFSLFVLIRGHNEPGGGFVGGLIAAAGCALWALPRGRGALLSLLRLRPEAIAAWGLLLALVSGLGALLLGSAFLTHLWTFPGGLAIGTTLLFDIGVYLAVLGSILTFLSFYLEA